VSSAELPKQRLSTEARDFKAKIINEIS